MLGTWVVVTLVLTGACGVGAVFTADAATIVTGTDVAALSDMVGVVLVLEFVLACTVFTGVVIIVVIDFDGPA